MADKIFITSIIIAILSFCGIQLGPNPVSKYPRYYRPMTVIFLIALITAIVMLFVTVWRG